MSRLPPLAKLPLNQRKEFRDEFDAKKEATEKDISTFFGQPWKISADPLAIVPYAKDGDYGHHSPGTMCRQYFENALRGLKYYKERNGDDIVTELNKLCTAHTMVLDVDPEDKIGYCGGKITADGNLALLFGTKNLAVNMDNVMDESKITDMVNSAPAGDGDALSFKVRKSIKEDYDTKIKEVSDSINKIFGKDITLVPNFEGTAKALKDAGRFDSEETTIGGYTYFYFKSLLSTLESNKVADDEMIKEAIEEEMSGNKIEFVVVPGDAVSGYGDTKFEGGALQIRTNPKNYGVNIDDITRKLLDQL